MYNRYLVCLLLCTVLLYYAIPNLSLKASGLAGVFALTWLCFALLVIAGNLSALLFPPIERQALDRKQRAQVERRKLRSYD